MSVVLTACFHLWFLHTITPPHSPGNSATCQPLHCDKAVSEAIFLFRTMKCSFCTPLEHHGQYRSPADFPIMIMGFACTSVWSFMMVLAFLLFMSSRVQMQETAACAPLLMNSKQVNLLRTTMRLAQANLNQVASCLLMLTAVKLVMELPRS